MLIILSQRIDYNSDYEDIPFSIYHFPKRYINQIHIGDRFIYYQGDRHKKDNRYYYGCGVIGDIYVDYSGDFYYAKIIEGKSFKEKVPIYIKDDSFWESIDYEEVRKKPNPSWQNSIRKISKRAFKAILNAGKIDENTFIHTSELESEFNAFEVLRKLNEKYKGLRPEQRAKKVSYHLDRVSSVTKAMKELLGAKCQICGWSGFTKRNGNSYIEAHHLAQISKQCPNSLCTENIILVCPNSHNEIHYGKEVLIMNDEDCILIKLSNAEAKIHKNSLRFLENLHT